MEDGGRAPPSARPQAERGVRPHADFERTAMIILNYPHFRPSFMRRLRPGDLGLGEPRTQIFGVTRPKIDSPA